MKHDKNTEILTFKQIDEQTFFFSDFETNVKDTFLRHEA